MLPATPTDPSPTDAYLWIDVFSNDVVNHVLVNRVLIARFVEPGDVEEQPVIVDGTRSSIGVLLCNQTTYVDMEDRSAVVATRERCDVSHNTLTNIAVRALRSR